MPEHLRSLIVILFLSAIFFAYARRFACVITDEKSFTRRRNLWLVLTLAAFLAHSFWIYVVIAILLILYSSRQESNPPALFFSILFILPAGFVPIPGFGLINFIFELSHVRLLSLFILLPAYFSLRRQDDTSSFGRTGPDKVLAAYFVLMLGIFLRESNFTSTLRSSFYLFVDVFLPYFVISRSLKNLQNFRDALLGLVLAIMLLAPLAVLESIKGWLLYSSLNEVLGLVGAMTGYLPRDGMIRVIVSAGHPIALGYLMTVGLGLYLFLLRYIEHKHIRRLGTAVLIIGLIAPLSRGPWIGAAVMFVIYIATGPYAVRRLMNLGLAVMIALPLIAILPGGERAINLLPFIGTTEKENIGYREQLLENSMIVIQRNPWFGSEDFVDTPEMEAMRQGQGIIDIVNHYLVVTLQTGFVGLTLFVGFFATILWAIYRAIRSIPDKFSEEFLLGRALFATLFGILVIIFTTSTIGNISIVLWSVAGMGVAYAQMIRKQSALMGTIGH